MKILVASGSSPKMSSGMGSATAVLGVVGPGHTVHREAGSDCPLCSENIPREAAREPQLLALTSWCVSR